ncbi:TetR family transcriptional regulator [Gordonia sp. FQ]|uniref:TetR family transcriptional regulator n=1 Tax=Gordonia sp. FQ TaxID=3446634 RepID=UPI003F863BEE
MTSDPRSRDADLTAKAKIRNAALDLYADQGEGRVSLRAVAAAAGVSVSLLQHHFKTKDGLRAAVEDLIVDYHRAAIAGVPNEGSAADIAAARDDAVRKMLTENPPVVDYMRRVLLDPSGPRTLLSKLTELSRQEVVKLRDRSLVSTRRSVAEQTTELMVRQLGHMFLQPMVDAMWDQLDGTDDGGIKPRLSVTMRREGGDEPPRPVVTGQ